MSQSWGPNGSGSFGGPPQGAASWLGDDASGDGVPVGGAGGPLGAGGAPNGGGWTPAPAASLLPRRPLDFGEVLGATFRIVARNLGVLVGSTFLLVGVANVVGVAVLVPLSIWLFDRVDNATADTRGEVLTTAIVGTALGALVPVVLAVVGTALAQAITVLVVADAAKGERTRFRSAWARAWKRVWPLAGFGALYGLAAIAAFALIAFAAALPLILFGAEIGSIVTTVVLVLIFGAAAWIAVFWLSVKLLFIPSAIVVERAGLGAAIRRSWALTRAQFWRLFGTTLLMSVVLGVVSSIVSSVPQFFLTFLTPVLMPFGDAGGDSAGAVGTILIVSLVLSVFTMLVSAAVVALQSTLGAVLYVDTRMRREGLGLHLDRFVEERASGARPAWDPFAEPAIAVPAAAPGPAAAGSGVPAHGPAGAGRPGAYGGPGAAAADPRYGRYGSLGAPAPGGASGAVPGPGRPGGQGPIAAPAPRTYGEASDARAARDRAAAGPPQQWMPAAQPPASAEPPAPPAPRPGGASAQHTYDPFAESDDGK